MTLMTTDAVLMAEHLAKHEAEIRKLRHYQMHAKATEIRNLLQSQIEMMEHHVKTMLALLDGKTPKVPALPHAVAPMAGSPTDMEGHVISDKDVCMDALLTASAMGADNYHSAIFMGSPAAKEAHLTMALQNAELAFKYQEVAKAKEWVRHLPAGQTAGQVHEQFSHMKDTLAKQPARV